MDSLYRKENLSYISGNILEGRTSYQWSCANHCHLGDLNLPDSTSFYQACKDSGEKKPRSIPMHFFKHKYISNLQQNLPHNPLFFQLVRMQEYGLQSISSTHKQVNSRWPLMLRQHFKFSLGYNQVCYTSRMKLWWSCAFQIFANN